MLSVASIGLPFVLGEYLVSLASQALIFSIFVLGINVLLGVSGLISLGHAMFLGAGAYGVSVGVVILGMPLWASFLCTLVSLAMLGLMLGAICVRTAGVQFLLITLAFSQMLYGAAVKLKIVGGDDGLSGVPRPDIQWIGHSLNDEQAFYYYVLFIWAVVIAVLWRLTRSPFGLVLMAIRENERRVIASGYNTYLYKIGAFAISSMVAGVSGILLGQRMSFVNPDLMTWQMSGEGLLMAIIGGPQSFFGPVIGASFYVLAKEILAAWIDEYMMFFGVLFMLLVALSRGGLMGLLSAFRRVK